MKIQEIIDAEQNKIRTTANSLTDIELVRFVLLYDGRLYQCQVNRLTREELVDMYCEIIFTRNSL